MKNPFPLPSLNLLFTLIFSQIPSILSQNNTEWYSSCTNLFTCGEIEPADYPFWGGNRPAVCGRPGLQLTCESNTPAIEIMAVKYRVLEINPNSQIIRIIRWDFAVNHICPDKFVNSTIDFNLFEYNPGYANLTVQYGCPPLGIEILTRLSCTVNGTVYENGYFAPGAQGPGVCQASVFFPIHSESFEGIVKIPDIRQLVESGFELRWKENGEQCAKCRKSGGNCGYDMKLNQFTCLCPPEELSEFSSCRRRAYEDSNGSEFALNHPGECFS